MDGKRLAVGLCHFESIDVESSSKKGHAKRRGLRAFEKTPGTPLLLEFDPPHLAGGLGRKAQRRFDEYQARSFQTIRIKK